MTATLPLMSPEGTSDSASAEQESLVAIVQRWRCAGCGNLTRFDVSRTRRTTEYWHFDLAGHCTIESVEVLSEQVETVRCRWCGRNDAIESIEPSLS